MLFVDKGEVWVGWRISDFSLGCVDFEVFGTSEGDLKVKLIQHMRASTILIIVTCVTLNTVTLGITTNISIL